MKIFGKHNNKGFTLVEILIVVAIIAVLVVIAIPIYNTQMEKSRAKVCEDNRESLSWLLKTNMMLSEVDEERFQALTARHIRDSLIVCPSGGTISAERTDLDTAVIYCDKHYPGQGGAYGLGPGVARLDFRSPITSAKDAAILAQGSTPERIDSGASGPYVTFMRTYFNEKGLDLTKSNIKSWAMERKGTSNEETGIRNFDCYWTEVDISELDPGTEVRVMKYNEALKTYTAGKMEVIRHSNLSYNILDGTSFVQFSGQDDKTKKDFAQTLAIYYANP